MDGHTKNKERRSCRISVRGGMPPDLPQRISALHAMAIAHRAEVRMQKATDRRANPLRGVSHPLKTPRNRGRL